MPPAERSGSDHERFMDEALDEARRAIERAEVPVGCVLVHGGDIVGRGHNLREGAQDPTAHAEIVALQQAAQRLGSWRLSGVTAYVTLEPCAMCAGAMVNARVERLVYGCADPKAGAVHTLYDIGRDERLNHRFEVIAGVRKEACAARLSDFFGAIRASRAGRGPAR